MFSEADILNGTEPHIVVLQTDVEDNAFSDWMNDWGQGRANKTDRQMAGKIDRLTD